MCSKKNIPLGDNTSNYGYEKATHNILSLIRIEPKIIH